MIKLKVIKSTDDTFIGHIFEWPDLDVKKSRLYTNGLFSFDYIQFITETRIRLWNSNYTAIVEIVKN